MSHQSRQTQLLSNNSKWMQSVYTQHAHVTREQFGHSDRRGSWHTVETGHNVGLTAITSKVIWTPDGKKKQPQEEGRGGGGGGRGRWMSEEVERKQRDREWKGEYAKEKVREGREGRWGGRREGERHRIRTTAQLQTAEAECSHGWHHRVHGVVHSSLRVDLRKK